MAVREVFGAHAGELVMTSVKSMSGHLTAAASALGTPKTSRTAWDSLTSLPGVEVPCAAM
jgi:hypothetical protein